ncbi:angiopoietin-4-like [Oratosquilla oratoria]|uniref:angiopoietin-4-like n=1 Tax=Oratosquilla oratoria TaxID=337810 RepID=UPI003F76AC20
MATQIIPVALVLLAMAGHVLTQNETTAQPQEVTPEPDIPTTTTTGVPVPTTEGRKLRPSLGRGQGRGRGRGFGRREENTRRISIQTFSQSELDQENARRGGALDPILGRNELASHEEVIRRQMDTLILLLQRVSDRLTSLETLQGQMNERVDTINYRLTKIELHAEERKANFLELSNIVRHRMEATDFELQSIKNIMDSLKSDMRELGGKHVQLKTFLDSKLPRQTDGDTGVASRNSLVKIQQMMSNLQNLKGMTTSLKDELKEMGHNITILTNSTNYLHQVSDDLVTKQYLHTSLLDMKPSMSPFEMMTPLLLQQQAPQRGRRKKDPEDCWAVKKSGENKSGVYRIHPLSSPTPFFVYCDMKTDGGGWTVIQRREDGTVDFLREWKEYKYGFGNLAGEFWMGNEKIYYLTNHHVSELRVDLADFDQQEGYAKYAAFAIGSEEEGYSLKMLGEYSGDAGDSLSYQVGQRFSTIDNDFDAHPTTNCARDHEGAWWYRACETSNLNGRYLHGPSPVDHEYKGMYWYDFRGPMYSLWRSKMMIRRGGHVNKPIFKDMKGTTTPRPAPTYEQSFTEKTPQEYSPDRYPNPEHDPYYEY